MKKIIYSALLASGILLVSCATDKKDDPTAPAPSTDARDKFIAYWNASVKIVLPLVQIPIP
jgi:hypothetical protein